MSPIRFATALAAPVMFALSVAGPVATDASAADGRWLPPRRLDVIRTALGWCWTGLISRCSRIRRPRGRANACPKGGGPLFALAESDPDWRERPFAPSALRIYGSSVGWAVNVPNESTGPAGGCRITLVRRARYFRPGENAHARGWFSPAAIRAGYRANARVGTLVVRPSLSIAWIAFPPYSRRYTIYVAQHNSAFKHEVAAGSRIDPRSLRRHGDRIFWTEAGRRRSAPFPAWGIACRRGKWAASQRFKSEASGPLAKDPLTEG